MQIKKRKQYSIKPRKKRRIKKRKVRIERRVPRAHCGLCEWFWHSHAVSLDVIDGKPRELRLCFMRDIYVRSNTEIRCPKQQNDWVTPRALVDYDMKKKKNDSWDKHEKRMTKKGFFDSITQDRDVQIKRRRKKI